MVGEWVDYSSYLLLEGADIEITVCKVDRGVGLEYLNPNTLSSLEQKQFLGDKETIDSYN